AFYGEALVRDMTAYYGVAREGSRTSAADYLAFCDRHDLPYEEAWPEPDQLRRDRVDICLRVPEPVFDFWDLKALVEKRLLASPAITLRLGHEVVGGALRAGGTKRLDVRHAGVTTPVDVDVLINAAFYDINTACAWFDFPRRAFQYDTKELAIIRLPTTTRLAITVMDGPFCTFLPMGRSGKFLLGHVRESVLSRDIGRDTPTRERPPSRWTAIRDASAEFFPFVRQAEFLESMFTRIVVDPDSAADDARVSEITAHGRGCWTVFSAKIVSCVTVADALAGEIARYLGD
ncbi:MAG: hypothetical protein HY216_04280, partial [Candidatus Rokubacteria bacterium]|nr:hypothetical protein [Candidatus Rokubacteria bacterium]